MPRFVVYVERLVPQYRTVVVEAATSREIYNPENKKRIFDHAQDLEWLDDPEGKTRRNGVEVVEVTDDEPDLVL